MSKKVIAQQLATMTYRDMIDFSEILSQHLAQAGQPVDPTVLSQVLSALPYNNEQCERTNEILMEVFHRKRQITIQPEGEGVLKICCPTVEGAIVFDKDIREGVSQLLDTLTVLQGLQ